jgi:hypothetical protein
LQALVRYLDERDPVVANSLAWSLLDREVDSAVMQLMYSIALIYALFHGEFLDEDSRIIVYISGLAVLTIVFVIAKVGVEGAQQRLANSVATADDRRHGDPGLAAWKILLNVASMTLIILLTYSLFLLVKMVSDRIGTGITDGFAGDLHRVLLPLAVCIIIWVNVLMRRMRRTVFVSW